MCSDSNIECNIRRVGFNDAFRQSIHVYAETYKPGNSFSLLLMNKLTNRILTDMFSCFVARRRIIFVVWSLIMNFGVISFFFVERVDWLWRKVIILFMLRPVRGVTSVAVDLNDAFKACDGETQVRKHFLSFLKE